MRVLDGNLCFIGLPTYISRGHCSSRLTHWVGAGGIHHVGFEGVGVVVAGISIDRVIREADEEVAAWHGGRVELRVVLEEHAKGVPAADDEGRAKPWPGESTDDDGLLSSMGGLKQAGNGKAKRGGPVVRSFNGRPIIFTSDLISHLSSSPAGDVLTCFYKRLFCGKLGLFPSTPSHYEIRTLKLSCQWPKSLSPPLPARRSASRHHRHLIKYLENNSSSALHHHPYQAPPPQEKTPAE